MCGNSFKHDTFKEDSYAHCIEDKEEKLKTHTGMEPLLTTARNTEITDIKTS